jgi:alpha-1,2-mannosyltransferase
MRAVRHGADRLADRIRDVAKPWEVACFLWVPAIAIAYAFWYELRSSTALEDFGIFRNAAKVVIRGDSPFPAAVPHALEHFNTFVYPPSTAILFLPLAEIPLELARVLMLVLGVVCVLVALRLFDVRDWRCYGIAAMSAPAVNSLALGAITSFLLVGAAATWRYRDRPGIAGPAAALTAVGKLFLWPLGLWLFVTRRIRAAAAFVVVALVVGLGGWAVIGFAGLLSYPHLLHVLSDVEQGSSYSPVALLGLTGTPAVLLSVALVLGVALAVALAARGPDGDRRSFAVAALGALLATPILWLHYFLLLFVPIALYRPRLSAIWFAPVILWVTPATHSHGVTWHIVYALAITALVTARTLAESRTRWMVTWTRSIRPRLARRVQPAVGAD